MSSPATYKEPMQNPFDTIESAHQYMHLLDKVLEEVQSTTEEDLKRIARADVEGIGRSADAIHRKVNPPVGVSWMSGGRKEGCSGSARGTAPGPEFTPLSGSCDAGSRA